MIKIIASDIDGTLLKRGEKMLSPALEEAVLKALSRGVTVAFITGRSYPLACAVCPTLSDKLYFYCCGGAVCVYNGKTLYGKPIVDTELIRAYSTAKRKGCSLMLSAAQTVYFFGSDSEYQGVCDSCGGAVRISSLAEIKEPVYKISFFTASEDTVYGYVPRGLRLWYKRNGLEEYINAFAGKGQAISELMLRKSALAGEVVSAGNEIGDDTEMLKKTGIRYATEEKTARVANAILVKNPLDIFGL